MKLFLRRPRKLTSERYTERWQAVQAKCANRRDWPQAIAEADKILEDALKKAHYKGKTTGERLVAAQHELTSNEDVWFGHKLSARIATIDIRRLKKQHIQTALRGFRQALRDLGALDAPAPAVKEVKEQ